MTIIMGYQGEDFAVLASDLLNIRSFPFPPKSLLNLTKKQEQEVVDSLYTCQSEKLQVGFYKTHVYLFNGHYGSTLNRFLEGRFDDIINSEADLAEICGEASFIIGSLHDSQLYGGDKSGIVELSFGYTCSAGSEHLKDHIVTTPDKTAENVAQDFENELIRISELDPFFKGSATYILKKGVCELHSKKPYKTKFQLELEEYLVQHPTHDR